MCITQCVIHDNPGAAWSASEQHPGFRAYTPTQLKLSQAKLQTWHQEQQNSQTLQARPTVLQDAV